LQFNIKKGGNHTTFTIMDVIDLAKPASPLDGQAEFPEDEISDLLQGTFDSA
jgi:hypothetical protein